MSGTIILLAAGGVAGYWVGVWRAEYGRWRRDADQMWLNRRRYRKDN